MKVEGDILGSRSLIVPTVSVVVKSNIGTDGIIYISHIYIYESCVCVFLITLPVTVMFNFKKGNSNYIFLDSR